MNWTWGDTIGLCYVTVTSNFLKNKNINSSKIQMLESTAMMVVSGVRTDGT